MALPPFATVTDLQDWIGEPITEEADTKRAEGVLRLASALVRRETGKSWVGDDGSLPATLPDDLELVTLAVAARGFTNPEGNTSEGIDDAQVARKVEESGLYLTASERDLLAPLAGRLHQGIGTVSTTRGDIPDTPWPVWRVNGPDPAPDEVS